MIGRPGDRDASIRRRAWLVSATLAGLIATAGLLAACGSATPTASMPDAKAAVAAITEGGLRDRLDALARVSRGSDGYRAVGAPGFDAAADLVAAELRAAGWSVTEESAGPAGSP